MLYPRQVGATTGSPAAASAADPCIAILSRTPGIRAAERSADPAPALDICRVPHRPRLRHNLPEARITTSGSMLVAREPSLGYGTWARQYSCRCESKGRYARWQTTLFCAAPFRTNTKTGNHLCGGTRAICRLMQFGRPPVHSSGCWRTVDVRQKTAGFVSSFCERPSSSSRHLGSTGPTALRDSLSEPLGGDGNCDDGFALPPKGAGAPCGQGVCGPIDVPLSDWRLVAALGPVLRNAELPRSRHPRESMETI